MKDDSTGIRNRQTGNQLSQLMPQKVTEPLTHLDEAVTLEHRAAADARKSKPEGVICVRW